MALKIQQRQRVILLNSAITKDYSWFFDLLNNNERITAELVAELPEQERSFIENVVPGIIKTAFDEWKWDANEPVIDKGPQENPACRAEWLNCSLDNTPNRYVYWIINIMNESKLNVGSTCVQDFMSDPRKITELEEEATKNFNHGLLNNTFPGIRNIILRWVSTLEDYPVLLPNYVEAPFLNLGRNLKESFDAAILQKNMDSDIYNTIERVLGERELLLQQVEGYVNKCLEREPKGIITKAMETWLKGGADEATKGLEELKKTGKISPFTACRIREPGYMEALVPELDKILKGMNLTVPGKQGTNYILEPTSHAGMKLLCPHRALLFECGHILYGDKNEQPSYAGIVDKSELADEPSRSFVERELERIHEQLGQRIFSIDIDFDEIVIRKRTGKYTILERKDFMNKFKYVVLNPSDTNLQSLQTYVETRTKEYSLEEMKDFEKLRREQLRW